MFEKLKKYSAFTNYIFANMLAGFVNGYEFKAVATAVYKRQLRFLRFVI